MRQPLRSLASRVRDTVALLQGGGRGWALATLAAGWFLTLGLRFVVPALLPVITDEFPVSNATAGAAITLLWVTYALMQFPAGALVDRLGERRLLVASTLGSAGTMAAYAVAPTFAVFLLATAGFGLASGLFGPPRGTVLTRLYDEGDGAAFGTVLAMGSIGAAVLPPLALYVSGWVGWRGAFGLTAPLLLLVTVGMWWRVPNRERSAPAGDFEIRTDGGSVGLRGRTRPVRRAMGSRKVILAVLGATLMLFVFQGLTAFFTTYLVTVKGIGEPTAGALFGLLFLGGALSQGVGGALADRFGHGRVLAAVSFLGTLPLVVLPFLDGLVPLALVSLFLGVRLTVGPVSNAYIVALLPPTVRGTAWGALRTGFFTVGAFGSTLVGAMADNNLFTEAFLLLAVLTAVAGVVYLWLPAREAT